MNKTIGLVIKGTKKSAQRAAARHGISTTSCRDTGGDIMCYAKCSSSMDAKANAWFKASKRRGARPKPGDLVYLSSCEFASGSIKNAGLVGKRSLRGHNEDANARKPPPVYHPRKGPPPGVNVTPLKGARRRKRR